MECEGSTKKFGIGFCTGRANVTSIINNCIPNVFKEMKKNYRNMSLTVFVAYDLNYNKEREEAFLDINLKKYPEIEVVYISDREIEKSRKEIGILGIKYSDAELIFGNGHDKGRNILLYTAIKREIDYLFYWDDDEYPVSVSKGNKLKWTPQNNILGHLKYIKNADITHGYHCGYISPIPYIDLRNPEDEKYMKTFIEALSNDIINWDSMKKLFLENNGVTYVDEKSLKKESKEVDFVNGGKWISGSNICLNLNNLKNIPAYYNPPGARGEDTFFSTMLKRSKVVKVPVWHFHDAFLKYVDITKKIYPEQLKYIDKSKDYVKERFLRACIGWVRYKPLLLYISSPSTYEENIKDMKEKLLISIPHICKLFESDEFIRILDEFEVYSKNVEKYYKDYIKVNSIWKLIKHNRRMLQNLNIEEGTKIGYAQDNNIIATFR